MWRSNLSPIVVIRTIHGRPYWQLLLRRSASHRTSCSRPWLTRRPTAAKLGHALIRLGLVKDEDHHAPQPAVRRPSINLAQFEIDRSVIKLIPAETALKYEIVPLSRSGATLTIAMTDPTNVFAMDDIKFMTGYNVEPVVASETAVVEAIQKCYPAPRKPPPRLLQRTECARCRQQGTRRTQASIQDRCSNDVEVSRN